MLLDIILKEYYTKIDNEISPKRFNCVDSTKPAKKSQDFFEKIFSKLKS